MALINHAKREINAKIVYYGREGVGKRASLKYLFDRIKPSLRGELKNVSASGDSLLFFDFSPFEHPVFGGYRLRLHMYSLVGAVSNPAAWKMTLKGADGVVIVADPSPEMVPVTRECVAKLRDFLAAYGAGLHDIPCVLQLNAAGSSEHRHRVGIAAELDLPDIRTCFSAEGCGEGVLEALSLICRDIMARIEHDETLQRDVTRTITPEPVMDDAVPQSMPHESAAHLTSMESAQSVAEVSSLNTEDLAVIEHCLETIQISPSAEGAEYSGGAVRIPLTITLGGESKRLVVSIAIEQA